MCTVIYYKIRVFKRCMSVCARISYNMYTVCVLYVVGNCTFFERLYVSSVCYLDAVVSRIGHRLTAKVPMGSNARCGDG